MSADRSTLVHIQRLLLWRLSGDSSLPLPARLTFLTGAPGPRGRVTTGSTELSTGTAGSPTKRPETQTARTRAPRALDGARAAVVLPYERARSAARRKLVGRRGLRRRGRVAHAHTHWRPRRPAQLVGASCARTGLRPSQHPATGGRSLRSADVAGASADEARVERRLGRRGGRRGPGWQRRGRRPRG